MCSADRSLASLAIVSSLNPTFLLYIGNGNGLQIVGFDFLPLRWSPDT
jgi:hypothetical protein